ncbi:zinc finger protein 771-like [Anguilla anguilla]|uniref:zinc finger protein 771-like n=1 Tax=Anguilla anguilla TaxID=7936 RepID=UPI0015B042CF|nr:zinc finger protein 771-like [Anguilla anguilla]XP_035278499.1 zinc finger protein 771-like [Anguilla anguilla]XP_035278500.1 zinc finger protein 771-like [Anguilla anguilla]XP_035278501.1 zinc finger protein 771-like [Anguilla anguilla]XP_035278502.1 zinc finger protein 771-like [Anguilla anguilla]
MSAEPEEADWLIGGDRFVIPVTIIFASDDDDGEEADGNEDKNFPSIKKEGRGRHTNTKETRGKSSEDTQDPGDGGTGVARATREDVKDPRLSGGGDKSRGKTSSQPPPGCGRRLYPSNRSGCADEGGGRTKLHPFAKTSHVKPDSRSVKSDPGVTNRRGRGWGRGSPARGGQEFTCEECGYSTNSSYNLACHARTHTGERPYACAGCGLHFRTRSSLNRHAQAQVCLRPAGGARRPAPGPKAELRALECADCGYSTPNAYNLKVHRRLHSDERPYRCGSCDSTFRTQSHLYRHERCHRQQVG